MRKKYGRTVKHLSDMFDVIKEENEFEHIEINVDDISYQSLIYDENYIELINQFAQKNEVTLSVHSCTDLNLGERVDRIREAAFKITMEIAEFCVKIHATYLVVHLGYCGFHSNARKKEQRLQMVMNDLYSVLTFLKNHGSTLLKKKKKLVEYNCYKSYLGDTYSDFEYIDGINGNKNIGYLFDIGHYNINNERTSIEFINKFRNRIQAYHVHRNDGVRDLHLALNDEWILENSELHNLLLQEYKSGKIVIFENYSIEEMKASKSAFQRVDM